MVVALKFWGEIVRCLSTYRYLPSRVATAACLSTITLIDTTRSGEALDIGRDFHRQNIQTDTPTPTTTVYNNKKYVPLCSCILFIIKRGKLY